MQGGRFCMTYDEFRIHSTGYRMMMRSALPSTTASAGSPREVYTTQLELVSVAAGLGIISSY